MQSVKKQGDSYMSRRFTCIQVGELIPGSPVVNRSLLFKSKVCVGFPCLLVIPLFGFFSGYSLVLVDDQVD